MTGSKHSSFFASSPTLIVSLFVLTITNHRSPTHSQVADDGNQPYPEIAFMICEFFDDQSCLASFTRTGEQNGAREYEPAVQVGEGSRLLCRKIVQNLEPSGRVLSIIRELAEDEIRLSTSR